MKFFKANLTAGVGYKIGAVGNYFRILSGTSDFRVEFDYGEGRTSNTNWKVGIGALLDKKFIGLTLISDVSQSVEIAYGLGRIDDSRLTGDIDVNGLLSVVQAGGTSWNEANVTLVAATAAVIVAADPTLARIKATVQPDVDIYVGPSIGVSAANGIFIPAGASVEVDNSAALYGYSAAGGLVRVLEDLK